LVLNINEKIEEVITGTEWSFSTLLKLESISANVADTLYNEMAPSELMDLIWEVKISTATTRANTFGLLYKHISLMVLKDKVMKAFQKHFDDAKVTFTQNVESPVEETPPRPTSFKDIVKQPAEELIEDTGDDGISTPKGVERL
jgi:hypothetical protein